jgi:hypothetical protein
MRPEVLPTHESTGMGADPMYIKPSVLGRMFVADIHISTTTAAVRTQ